MVSAATHAAHGYTFHQDAPNDALKLYQLAEMKLIELPASGAAQQVQLHIWIAQCLALMGHSRAAGERLRRAAALEPIPDAFDAADIEYVRARTMLTLGGRAIDGAADLASRAVAAYPQGAVRDSAEARITLAQVHVIMGDRRAAPLTAEALDAVEAGRSPRNRAMLAPLEEALRDRGDSTSVDLAQRAGALRTAPRP